MADFRSRLPVNVPIALVAVIVASGLVRVLMQHWREGAALIGGAMLVAAVLRMVLPDDRVGLLAIRSKAIDVLCYSGFGVMMIVLAVTITRGLQLAT
ncbi:DUF3017 domain-containing protein [Pseudonocardia sp. TRM90224]|uniref:DUF3017 domain-containing protein n=1 Tax=Pseudonocardia sp. TRM90224 TaxID=2812678 RepID=UPI001E5C7489|nr:DUF3017 domain-containing protein [Pseudonocardia sp. TRM90224]